MVKKLLITGAIEAILLTVAALVRPQFLVDHATWVILGSAVVLILVAWYESWRKPDAQSSGGGGQTTHGPHSPAIGSVGRDVHFHNHATPAAEQPLKTGHWRASDVDRARRVPRQAPKKLPDMPLVEVVRRVREARGIAPEKMDDCIRDAVVTWELTTWGRRPGKALGKIWTSAWESGRFSHVTGKIRYKDPDNSHGEHIWNEIHFNREEVDEWLPPKPEYEIIVI